MTAKRILIIGGLIVIVAGGITLGVYTAVDRGTTGHGDNNPDHPEGIFYVCGGCGDGFVLTVKQLAKHHEANWGEPVPCLKCGATKPRKGIRCPNCRRIFAHNRGATEQICSHCGKPEFPSSGSDK